MAGFRTVLEALHDGAEQGQQAGHKIETDIQITKDNARDYLPLVQALAEGKVIQINTGSERGWHDFQCDVSFDLPPNHYRIKPEPRVEQDQHRTIEQLLRDILEQLKEMNDRLK